MMSKEKRRVPKLRFPGFTEDWEQRKLGEVVKSYSGGTPTASNKEYYGGDIPFIRSAEINSDTTELYITQKGLDNSSAKIVEKGTILYAMYGATSGEVGISKINGAINQAILAMIPLDYNGKIIAQYLRKNKESIIGKYLQGGQGNLSANIILELPIQLPGLEESNQIANFLESFDKIITLHQRKLNNLKLKKKALLQKLFPKNGERYPELRFSGFTDAWEQRKLGDYLTIPEKEILEVASVNDLITVKLNLGGVESGASRDTLSLGSTVYYKRYAGQFIYGKQNFFNGSMGLIPKNLDGKGSSGDVPSFNVSNIEANYLYTYVSRESYWRLKVAAASGTGSKRIHEKTFLDFNIDVPSLDEQKLISNTFDLVNRFITLHQRKLDHLQLQKKALLQQMFV